MSTDPDDAPFAPPKENTEVGCFHCRRVYDSYRIELRDGAGPGGKPAWCCPTPNCGGLGFGFDIFPTDPNWVDPTGHLHCVVDDDDDEFDDEEWDDTPPPPTEGRRPDDAGDIPF
jgi:hypothetical protein